MEGPFGPTLAVVGPRSGSAPMKGQPVGRTVSTLVVMSSAGFMVNVTMCARLGSGPAGTSILVDSDRNWYLAPLRRPATPYRASVYLCRWRPTGITENGWTACCVAGRHRDKR